MPPRLPPPGKGRNRRKQKRTPCPLAPPAVPRRRLKRTPSGRGTGAPNIRRAHRSGTCCSGTKSRRRCGRIHAPQGTRAKKPQFQSVRKRLRRSNFTDESKSSVQAKAPISLLWRLHEALEQPGRGRFLKMVGVPAATNKYSTFGAYKKVSTLYRRPVDDQSMSKRFSD